MEPSQDRLRRPLSIAGLALLVVATDLIYFCEPVRTIKMCADSLKIILLHVFFIADEVRDFPLFYFEVIILECASDQRYIISILARLFLKNLFMYLLLIFANFFTKCLICLFDFLIICNRNITWCQSVCRLHLKACRGVSGDQIP